jgi:hypothetical protein
MCCLTFGVLAKETVIFTAPLWITLRPGQRARKRIIQTAFLTIPGLLVLIALRIAIPDPNYKFESLIASAIVQRITQPVSLAEYLPFGLLSVLALLNGRNKVTLWRYIPFLLLVYIQLLFATDTGRLLVYAFMPMLIMGLHGLTSFLISHQLPTSLAWFVACVSFAFALVL